jgi:hypothetical protein
MKTKELSKQVRDKVVEKYRSGLGYKKTSETLNIPRATKSGKNMAPEQTCQEMAAQQSSQTRQGGH